MIPPQYDLRESVSSSYAARTEQNVREADATLVLHVGPLRGGTALTARLARSYAKPLLTVALDADDALASARQWLDAERPKTLNVAGPRESQAPGIGQEAREFLLALLAASRTGRRQ